MRSFLLILIIFNSTPIIFSQPNTIGDSLKIAELEKKIADDFVKIAYLEKKIVDDNNQLKIFESEREWYNDSLFRQTTIFSVILALFLGLGIWASDRRIQTLIKTSIISLRNEITDYVIDKIEKKFEADDESIDSKYNSFKEKFAADLENLNTSIMDEMWIIHGGLDRVFAESAPSPAQSYIWNIRAAYSYSKIKGGRVDMVRKHLKNAIDNMQECEKFEDMNYFTRTDELIKDLDESIFKYELLAIREELDRLFQSSKGQSK